MLKVRCITDSDKQVGFVYREKRKRKGCISEEFIPRESREREREGFVLEGGY